MLLQTAGADTPRAASGMLSVDAVLTTMAIPDKLSIRRGEPGRVRLRVNQPVGSIRSGMLYLILAVA